MFCSNCGSKLKEGARFCDACGVEILGINNKLNDSNKVNIKKKIIIGMIIILSISILICGIFFVLNNGYSSFSHLNKETKSAQDTNTSIQKNVNISVSQVDSSNFPEIKLYFSVYDDNNELIKELSLENFKLIEVNSLEEKITSLKEPSGEESICMNVVMDISSSMGNGKLNESKQAAKNFLDIVGFNSGDKVELISFNNSYNVIQQFTNNKNLLINAIDNMSSAGDTALYDALYKALLETNAQSGSKCVIAFTDGKDNSSLVTQDYIIDLSKKLAIPIHIIGVGTDVDTDMLKRISQDTGGQYIAISDFNRLEEIYKDIFKKQKEQYVLTYTTKNTNANNSWQELQLEILNNNYKGTRTTKFMPKSSIDPSLLTNPDQKYTINREIVWDQCNKVTNNTLIGITFGNRGFVAVGNGGIIVTSNDGVTWKESISNVNNTLIAVGSNNNMYVAVGSQGTILTSNDGVSWRSQNSGISSSLRGITWDGSKFVVVGDDGTILNSSDGVNWTKVDLGITNTLYEIVWTGSKFVTVGSNGRILSSYDGNSWATISTNINNDLIGVTYSGNRFVAVGSLGAILISDDGENWFQSNSTTNITLITVIWDGSRFIAIGKEGVMQTSKNGYTWYINSTGTYNDLRCMKFNGTNLVAVGNSGTILISQN